MQQNRLSVNLCGVEFKNPLIGASGTFGYGLEYAQAFDISRLGGISVKGLSLKPAEGNPMPRIRETASGMLNSIGLQNVGVEAFLRDKLPFLRKYDTRIIANFWGRSVDEYVEVASILDGTEVDMLEMNISCPNVKEGGLIFGACPTSTRDIVRAVRQKVRKPLIVKLSPNVTDIKVFAKVCEEEGADAISAINTLVGMAINVNTRKPWLGNLRGGLSGPAIKPVAVWMVHEIARTVKIPVIGMGGIVNSDDAAEFFLAGASAVQVGTGNFVDHTVMLKIIDGLEKYCEKHDVANVSELTGGMIL